MTVSLSGVHVIVDDPDAALAFYRDTLGLTVRNEVARDGFRWIVVATAGHPHVTMLLPQPHAGRSKEDGDAIAALLAKGELGMVQFRSDNLDTTFDKLTGTAGVEVLQEPAKQPWGVRDAAVRDPARNTVRIDQG